MKKSANWKLAFLTGMGLACSLILFAKPGKEKPGKKSEIKVGGRMSNDIFGIKTEDYFANPMKEFTQIGSRLEDNGFNGLAIGGPQFIPIHSSEKFPLAMMNVTDARDASLHLFDDYAILTAMDLHTGKLFVDMAVEQKYVKPIRNPSANPPPPGRSSDGTTADLFQRLNIPKGLGEYLITGILWDRVSNRIQVKVGAPELSNSDQKFAQAILKYFENTIASDSIQTNVNIYSDVVNPNTPSLPEKIGINIFIHPKNEISHEKSSCILSGSIRIQDPELESTKTLGNIQASHYVPLTIVATGSRIPQPLVFRLKLKVKQESGTQSSPNLSGYFSVDLNQFGWLIGGQKYSIYAFAGTILSGPTTLEVTVP